MLFTVSDRNCPAKSAKKYASIWTKQGSPLAVHTAAQTEAIKQRLQSAYPQLIVEYAMSYGKPNLSVSLDRLVREQGVDRLAVVPLYPQFSATTTASVFDAVFTHFKKLRNPPELRMVKHYHDDPRYIASLAVQIRAHWAANPWVQGEKRMLVMTFHGLPKRNLLLGDPYYCECQKTARLLKTELGLNDDECTVTFQSRFGKATWLQSYTEPTLIEIAKTHARVDVVCPGFTSDCLETLEEIAMEAKEAYEHAGGKVFHYIPALNENADWIENMAAIIHDHLAGWHLDQTTTSSADEPVNRKARAIGLGAKQ